MDSGYPEIGFLEYKIPTMAHIFGTPLCLDHDFEPWWKANPATKNVPKSQRILNAIGEEVPFSVILRELANNNGKRLFHPVSNVLHSWMENKYIAGFLLFTHLIKLVEIYYQSTGKLKQFAINITKLLQRSAKNRAR